MKFVPVYAEENADTILYELLAEREPKAWISHERMPTFREHQEFMASRPFWIWVLIEHEGAYIGMIEATYRNELGIHLFKKHQGKGLGSKALQLFLDNVQPLPGLRALRNRRWTANVGIGNEESVNFFRKHGFSTIQQTMVLRDD